MAPTDVGNMELQMIKQILDILKEGGLDVVGFLDTQSWGNLLAVKDPTKKHNEHNAQRPTCNDCVVLAVSPSNVSRGVEGERCKANVAPIRHRHGERRHQSLDGCHGQRVEGGLIGCYGAECTRYGDRGIWEKVWEKAAVFYDLVKVAAWSMEQGAEYAQGSYKGACSL